MKKTALKTSITTFLLVIFSFAILQAPAAQAYEDVSSTDPAYEAIKYFEEKGILKKEKFFYPASDIKRAEFEKLAWNAAGFSSPRPSGAKSVPPLQPSTPLSTKFKDIPTSSPFAPYIQKSLSTKIIEWNAKDPNYYPNRGVKKIDALNFILETQGIGKKKIVEKKDIPFSDINHKSSQAVIIKAALENGIIEAKNGIPGEGKKFNPDQKITKSQAIQYLYKASQKSTKIPQGTIQIIQITGDDFTFIPGGKEGEDIVNNKKFKIFVDVWKKIHERFIYKDKINDEKMLYGAIKGMVEELDDKYTVFQEPQEAINFNETLSGEFEGIGISIDMIDGKVTVISPLRDSPAEKAGIHPNDIITKVGEKDIKGMKLEDVVKLIKGPKGTKVKLGISREGKDINFEITRQEIRMLIVDGYMKGEIAVIQIASFNQDTDEDFTETVEKLLQKKPKGFIIDVRSNPGGFLDTTLNIADHFLPKGTTIATLHFKSTESAGETFAESKNIPGRADMPNTSEVRYISLGKGELAAYPAVIIQNRGSASASEILAAALRDNGAATIIGEDSFGKGSVQELSNYADGSQIKISIAKWLTPKGINLTEHPIKPDKYVKDDPKKDGDEVMDAALGMLK